MPSSSTLVSILIIFGVALALTRRPITAVVTTIYMLGVVLVSSWVKLTHLGLALTLADVHFFLLRPIENFKLFFQYPLLGILLLAALLGAAVCLWAGNKFEQPWQRLARSGRGGWLRLAIGSLSVALAVVASWVAAPQPQAKVDNGDSYVAFLVMYESQHPQGAIGLLNLFFNNRSFEATLPAPRAQMRFPLPAAPLTITDEMRRTFPD